MSSARKGYRQCSKCKRNRATKFFSSARGRVCADCRKRRVKHASRAVRLWETHYISLDEYAQLLAAQDGVCAICKGARPYALDVDHDHAVEKALRAEGFSIPVAHRMSIRGLLCKRCNRRLLPSCGDSDAVLHAAMNYLAYWPAESLLGEEQAWVS